MSFRIEGKFEGEVDTKRFYMPGVKAIDNCPICDKEVVYDYKEHYISFPKIGTPCLLHFWCEDCDREWVQKVQLDLRIVVV